VHLPWHSCILLLSVILIFSNARVWMAYRSRESHIIVGCRIKRDPENTTYEEYDLSINFDDDGMSSEPPTLIEFQGRLFIFWKTSVGNKPGRIVYTSTEDGSEWNSLAYLSNYQTASPPASWTFGGRLYIAFLMNESKPARINTVGTNDGTTWSNTPSLHVFSGGLVAKSPYAPCFSVYNGQSVMFWGGESDTVYTAPFFTQTESTNNGISTNVMNHAAEKVVHGKWQTQIGNAAVYRSQQQWIVTTTKNGEISIATNDEFETRYNLTEQQPKAKSARRVGACIMPGFYGHNNSMPWTLVLVYRGYHDTNLYETYLTVG
jgi:hypothetical protein